MAHHTARQTERNGDATVAWDSAGDFTGLTGANSVLVWFKALEIFREDGSATVASVVIELDPTTNDGYTTHPERIEPAPELYTSLLPNQGLAPGDTWTLPVGAGTHLVGLFPSAKMAGSQTAGGSVLASMGVAPRRTPWQDQRRRPGWLAATSLPRGAPLRGPGLTLLMMCAVASGLQTSCKAPDANDSSNTPADAAEGASDGVAGAAATDTPAPDGTETAGSDGLSRRTADSSVATDLGDGGVVSDSDAGQGATTDVGVCLAPTLRWLWGETADIHAKISSIDSGLSAGADLELPPGGVPGTIEAVEFIGPGSMWMTVTVCTHTIVLAPNAGPKTTSCSVDADKLGSLWLVGTCQDLSSGCVGKHVLRLTIRSACGAIQVATATWEIMHPP